MSHAERYRNSRGATAPRVPSPLPQGYAQGEEVPVRLVHGFLTDLPGRSRLFFQRVFFAQKPTPIQQAGFSPFPREIPIATIVAPKRQVIVIRSVAFKAYQHSGIGVEDIIEVPPSRTATYLGFKFMVGNRGLSDFMTNVPAAGVPLTGLVPVQANVAPRSGQGTLYPFSGESTPSKQAGYAAYAMSGDQIVAAVTIFRPTDYDLRLFSVEISGWLSDEVEFQRIIDKLGTVK